MRIFLPRIAWALGVFLTAPGAFAQENNQEPASQPTSAPASQPESAPTSLPTAPEEPLAAEEAVGGSASSPAASQSVSAPASQPTSAPLSAASAPTSSLVEDGGDILETTVTEKLPMTAASSSTVRDRDFLLKPHPRPADILMITPGLFVVQHAGGGKANQYFLRGFDADHGTDVAIFVDGVPVNNVSHGHGQGYADLHFVIPEIIEKIEVYKGPYFAEFGDFATAGAFNLVTKDAETQSSISVGGGSFDTFRGVLKASPKLEGYQPLIAAEVYGTNGPFENKEGLLRYNIFAKVSRDLSARDKVALVFQGYGAGWNASGQIPQREVLAGRLGLFGTIDPTEGGNSQRHGVYATYRALPGASSEISLMAYLHQYRFKLFSNFTFFSADPVNGDQIEQGDDRTTSGLKGHYRFLKHAGEIDFDTTFGVEIRNDLIDNVLFTSNARERLAPLVDARIRQGSFAVYAREEITPLPWLRAIFGLRGDYFGFDVTDNLEDQSTLGNATSGVAQAALLSPKASLVLSPLSGLDLFLNFGRGFHSNDARGVVRRLDPVTALAPATGYEVGLRTRLFDRLDLAAAFFGLNIGSEIVWVGDAGVTEARGPTERLGGELEGRLMLLPWLFADLDVSLTRALFTEEPPGANLVPLAPRFLLSGGLSALHPSGLSGRLGVFSIGDRPATEDGFLTAEGFTRADLSASYRQERFEIGLSIQNLTNVQWREAQFANVSRLPQETDASSCPAGTRPAEEDGLFLGCEDVHFTPGVPFNLQATVTLFF